MDTRIKEIFEEYSKGISFKESLSSKGLTEQSRINERFFRGDQWYGAKCGNDRPLVRHNIIKRIGEYKMSQIVSNPFNVIYSAKGVENGQRAEISGKLFKEYYDNPTNKLSNSEINSVLKALGQYHSATSERVGFEALCGRALKNAYISGTGIIYTYWNPQVKTGLFSDQLQTSEITGDICCEVLRVEDVYFGDGFCEDVQSQPYIIISTLMNLEEVRAQAAAFGASQSTLKNITGDSSDKVLVLTKLYKEKNAKGETTVRCIRVTEKAVIREPFDTRLRLYPLSVFRWEERANCAYGDTEVTYLIPNQIAVNRMITASVWATVAMGMPIMTVNGDTVTDDITNEPGQIIKIYGSNEDVAGAVKYVAPPDSFSVFEHTVESLIKNTLVQSGANEVALGDSRPDNASALQNMYSAATLPLKLLKNRFYSFVEEIARIWSDFWVTQYGMRSIKIKGATGEFYLSLDFERYKNLYLTARVDVEDSDSYSGKERYQVLSELYKMGAINVRQYLERLPKGIIGDITGILNETPKEDTNAGI